MRALRLLGAEYKLTIALLIGGVSFADQDRKLAKGADVLIATPGRLLDHFERGKLMMSGVEVLVVDEADRMLDMGFIPDIERICKLLPITRQTLFFSATMPPEIQRNHKDVPAQSDADRGGGQKPGGFDDHARMGRSSIRPKGQARCAAARNRRAADQERHRVLQPQTGCSDSRKVVRAPQPFRPRPAWRHEPARPARNTAEVPRRRDNISDCKRCGGTWPGYP